MTNIETIDMANRSELARILARGKWCDGCVLTLCGTEGCADHIETWMGMECEGEENPPAENVAEPQQEAPAERNPDKTMINDVTTDNVNHPSHYNRDGAMECIREMVVVFGYEATINFCKLNAWKYRYRASEKNGAEDMAKSDWYVKMVEELTAEAAYF